MPRLGIIGAGRIARTVIDAVLNGGAGDWQLVGVLARQAGARDGIGAPVEDNISDFLRHKPDLIVEMAGPAALREHGVAALRASDLWSISGMALADGEFMQALESAGRLTHHRVRLLPGAISGLDGVAAAAVDPAVQVRIRAATANDAPDAKPEFVGSAQDVLGRYSGINVIAAIAVAGAGLEQTRVEYLPAQPGVRRRFTVTSESQYGRFSATSEPVTTKENGTRTVSASVIAALARETQVIWAG